MKLYLVIICICIMSCEKNTDPLENFSQNNIEIKVFASNGDSSTHSFNGSYAPMYITSSYGSTGKFQAEGKINDSERKIVFGVDPRDNTNSKLICKYFTGGTNPTEYNTGYLTDSAVIIFTSYGNNNAVGSFYAKCRSFSDSIIITGTFRGNYNL